jgi:hypothetical protein
MNDEAEGLARLHAAQQQFQATGEQELLQQCLWNEAAYLDHVQRIEEGNAVRRRSRQLESDAAVGFDRLGQQNGSWKGT